MTKTPLIIDTDLTRDDVAALAIAAGCENVDIKAITCYGEWFVETVGLRDEMGLDCPVCWGAMKPVFGQEVYDDIYGCIGACETENIKIGAKDEEYPWDKIYAEALKADGALEIVTLGPVTNIAITLLRYPQIKPLIRRIFCFAGSGHIGNIAPYSEYNAYTDPDALKIVFDSGIDVVMCGLDGIESCTLTAEDFSEIYAHNPQIKNILTAKGLQPASAAAMCCYLNLDSIPVKDFYVAVETKSSICRGQTVVDRFCKNKKAPNIKVVMNSNKKLFVSTLISVTR